VSGFLGKTLLPGINPEIHPGDNSSFPLKPVNNGEVYVRPWSYTLGVGRVVNSTVLVRRIDLFTFLSSLCKGALCGGIPCLSTEASLGEMVYSERLFPAVLPRFLTSRD